ncbi:hypothetical protein O181_074059 [Austropuccinia psidii MF-1]|uniref:Uncharacterized protein n=1 Tax=Austropuccinia psidii MF-1 TaxID=1389203 RepID=A0A9Q3F7X4_9BASI|nr:hypothetical protein [Austropuccinia psidii MF-1]
MEGASQLSNQRWSLAETKPTNDLPSAHSESLHSNQALSLEQKFSHEGDKGLCAPTEQDVFMDSATLPKNSLHLNFAQLCDQKHSLWEDPAMYSLVENQASVCFKSIQMEEKLIFQGLTEAPPSSSHPPLLEEIETRHDNPIKQLPLFIPLGQLESSHTTDPQTSPVIAFEEPMAESLANLDPTVTTEYTTDIPEDNAMDRPCKAIISRVLVNSCAITKRCDTSLKLH